MQVIQPWSNIQERPLWKSYGQIRWLRICNISHTLITYSCKQSLTIFVHAILMSTNTHGMIQFPYTLKRISKDTLRLFDTWQFLCMLKNCQLLLRITNDFYEWLPLHCGELLTAENSYGRCRKKTVALSWRSFVNMWTIYT